MVTQRKAAGGIKQSTNIHTIKNIIQKQSEMVDQMKNLKQKEQEMKSIR